MNKRGSIGARSKIRKFFEDHVGQVVTTHEIAEVAGIKDYPRRIRELRDEEGMQILSDKDRHELKPGQYMLLSLDRLPAVDRSISLQLRSEILERNGFTCRMCGASAGEPDSYNPNRKIRLHIDHIIPITQGGLNVRDNLRALCTACNEGKANLHAPSEDAINILARIRKQPRAVQREIYEKLKHFIEGSSSITLQDTHNS